MTSFIHSVVTVHFLGARLGARLVMALNTYTLQFSPLYLSRLRTLITTPRSHPLISGPVSVKLTTALSHPGHWSPLLNWSLPLLQGPTQLADCLLPLLTYHPPPKAHCSCFIYTCTPASVLSPLSSNIHDHL